MRGFKTNINILIPEDGGKHGTQQERNRIGMAGINGLECGFGEERWGRM
jgi:hypothetical protein